MSAHVHIYAPPVVQRQIVAGVCGDCNRRTRFLAFFREWFGWNHTCLRCGRVWDDGEWIALPFVRGARRKSVADAKARWRRLSQPRDETTAPPVSSAPSASVTPGAHTSGSGANSQRIAGGEAGDAERIQP